MVNNELEGTRTLRHKNIVKEKFSNEQFPRF